MLNRTYISLNIIVVFAVLTHRIEAASAWHYFAMPNESIKSEAKPSGDIHGKVTMEAVKCYGSAMLTSCATLGTIGQFVPELGAILGPVGCVVGAVYSAVDTAISGDCEHNNDGGGGSTDHGSNHRGGRTGHIDVYGPGETRNSGFSIDGVDQGGSVGHGGGGVSGPER